MQTECEEYLHSSLSAPGDSVDRDSSWQSY